MSPLPSPAVMSPAHGMKILIWNVNRANTNRDALWEIFCREESDLALLQEVTEIPKWVGNNYNCKMVAPRYFSGQPAPFKTAVLSRWHIDTRPFLSSSLDWVNEIHQRQYGWILESEVVHQNGERIRVVSVHIPAWPIPSEELYGIDYSVIRLTNNPALWFTEILWSLVGGTVFGDDTNLIVGGDFNSSVLFDFPTDRGNRQVMDRMNALGLTDCVKHCLGKPVPTFRKSTGSIKHQPDYCYVNGPMLKRLTHVRVLGPSEIFDHDPRISDHLPIICEFA